MNERKSGNFANICDHTFYADVLTPNSIILDLGGSTGAFSRGVRELYGCHCHVVEAMPHNFSRIPESAGLVRHHYAMGGTSGTTTMHVAKDECHWGSAEQLPGVSFGDSVEVPSITLDDLIERLGLKYIDLLKVDIEGSELAMFNATRDATFCNIGQITIEFHDFIDPTQRPEIERIKHRLGGLGFTCIVFTRRHHGDVLFLNRTMLSMPPWLQLFALGIKYSRGLKRMANQHFATQ